ncbi:MAG TPA: dTDP-4-dehydrorhamnose 3,5-epimerase family protein [Candidatus Binatia bacterium]|nr:dTDP-4-dehydrorhamnose 3,5-epimerase family protein [Candidatus Binatia bacterium]
MELTPDAKRAFHVQSYAAAPRIEGVVLKDLVRHHDDAGSFTELGRLRDGRLAGLEEFVVRQVNYSELEPGAIKAFHVHLRQTDVWYVPPADRLLMVLVDVRRGSPTEGRYLRFMLGDGTSRLVRIPPGVAHGVRNLGRGPARVIYFVDQEFTAEPERCDEGRLPWDFVGADVWDVTRG